jgi:hypothetical protein
LYQIKKEGMEESDSRYGEMARKIAGYWNDIESNLNNLQSLKQFHNELNYIPEWVAIQSDEYNIIFQIAGEISNLIREKSKLL